MEIIRHIKVDLYGDTQHFAVAAKQMDMGTRYIGVTLMEDGVVYEIPDNVEVIINMTKPDKTHVHNDGEKSGNEALIPLTRGMLQVHDFNPRSREGSDTIWSDIVSRTGEHFGRTLRIQISTLLKSQFRARLTVRPVLLQS